MEEATPKQLNLMKKLGIPIPTPCTKEIAKQMIAYDLEMVQKEKDKPELVRPEYAKKEPEKPKNGKEYHAAIETCRIAALQCSIDTLKNMSVGDVKELTRQYFEWIWNGRF